LKADPANPNLAQYEKLSSIPAGERIRTLAAREFGRSEGLSA